MSAQDYATLNVTQGCNKMDVVQSQNILDLLGGDSVSPPISKPMPPGSVPVKGDILDLLGDLDLSAAPQNTNMSGWFSSVLSSSFISVCFFILRICIIVSMVGWFDGIEA